MTKLIKIISITVILSLLVSCTALYNDLAKEYGGGVNLETLPQTSGTSTTRASETSTNSPVGSTPSSTSTTAKAEEDNPPEILFSAPDFTVLDAEGNTVNLSDFAGKPIVLNFWATWCGYCKEEMPDFQKAYEKYPDVQFVMVNATSTQWETIDAAKSYISENKFTFPVFFDTEGSATTAYGVSGFPATYFIDANGNPVARASGMISLETIEQGIDMITSK